jgi:hypothetical protein
MARISVVQPINLTSVRFEKDHEGKPKRFVDTLILVKGVNEVANEVLTHPYIQAHMKAGSVTIVPDPLDPEDIAAAAEEIARRARAEAEAAKALKLAKQKEIDDALAAAAAEASKQEPAPADKDDTLSPEALAAAAKKHAEEEEFQRLLHAEAEAAKAPAEAEKPAA